MEDIDFRLDSKSIIN